MSYFSALARQTGVRVAGHTIGSVAPVSRKTPSLEVEETRVAPQPPARSADAAALAAAPSPITERPRLPAPPPVAAPPLPVAAPPPARVPDVAPPPRAVAKQEPFAVEPPPPLIREVTIEAEAPPPEPPSTPDPPPAFVHYFNAPAEQSVPPATPAAAVQLPKPAPPPERRALPTLADVRKWVARPLLEAQSEDPFEPLPESTPFLSSRPATPVVPVKTETPDGYTLEIGSINITFDPPAQQPPPPPPAARQAAPAASISAEGRASRYYVRI
jgi:WAS/WASL-interacting protein